jgi:alpha-beta hydrolase superfamily lysophospholipase
LADVQRTIEVFTASDGYPLYYRAYDPIGIEPRGHLVCTHGIQSHGGWYVDSCTRLAAAGYQVSYLDRRGSGLNWLARGDAPSFGRLLDDLREFINKTTPPGLPAINLATSWSGKLAVLLAAEPHPVFQKLVLLCPGMFPKVKPPLKVRLGIARARGLRPAKLFPIPLDDPQLFTGSLEHQEFLRRDPLSIHYATARLLVESFRLDRRVRAIQSIPHLPILLQLAEHDRIIRNDHTESWLKSVAPQAKVIHYPNVHHTLEFEPHHPFVDDILRWLAE